MSQSGTGQPARVRPATWGVDASEAPDHDLQAAVFSCQPFSIADVSEKRSLNMPDGFTDETQGALSSLTLRG